MVAYFVFPFHSFLLGGFSGLMVVPVSMLSKMCGIRKADTSGRPSTSVAVTLISDQQSTFIKLCTPTVELNLILLICEQSYELAQIAGHVLRPPNPLKPQSQPQCHYESPSSVPPPSSVLPTPHLDASKFQLHSR